MRLDKFLKVSRLLKRRTVAKEIAEAGRVFVNAKLAKPATEVCVGDRIQLHYGRHQVLVEVLQIKDHVPASQADHMYTVIEDKVTPNQP